MLNEYEPIPTSINLLFNEFWGRQQVGLEVTLSKKALI